MTTTKRKHDCAQSQIAQTKNARNQDWASSQRIAQHTLGMRLLRALLIVRNLWLCAILVVRNIRRPHGLLQ